MSLKSSDRPSFADLSAKKRKCKHLFFDQVNKLVDWLAVQKLLCKYYPKGLRLAGRQAYDPLLLRPLQFKTPENQKLIPNISVCFCSKTIKIA